MGPSGWIDRFKKRSNTVYITPAVESMSNDSETGDDWKNDQVAQQTTEYDIGDMYDTDKTRLFFSVQPSKSVTYRGDSFHGGS
jgi:hypothetical protein